MMTDTLPPKRPEYYPGYKLLRVRGRGGYGEVWEAEKADGSLSALKFMPYADSNAASREIRAIQQVRQLNHPNLTTIDRVWCCPGYLVVAMELADGSVSDLHDAYQTEFGTDVAPDYLCFLLAQAAEALDYMQSPEHMVHGRTVGFQHCDIKPSNLLLFGETVKLCDFGLTSPLTATIAPHRRAGTLDYSAPEVFNGQLSQWTDQYALAVTYCQLRTSQLPFKDTPAEYTARYVRPRAELAKLPKAEQPIIRRALDSQPSARWPNSRMMIAELEKVACAVSSKR
jgi:serine/threonine protein kinase, bacterial